MTEDEKALAVLEILDLQEGSVKLLGRILSDATTGKKVECTELKVVQEATRVAFDKLREVYDYEDRCNFGARPVADGPR
jgi:hypothetical protein